MSDKIVDINKYKQKKQKEQKMLLIVIVIGALLGLASWKYFVEDVQKSNIEIPASNNITFNQEKPAPILAANLAEQFDKSEGKPILLYIYTTWCSSCKKNFDNFNEIAREFQNSDLQVIAIAIDRDLTPEGLQAYLNEHGDFYFKPQFLFSKEGFIDFLRKKNIDYKGRIPYTVLVARDGEVVLKYVGVKNKNYLRKKIIAQL